MLLTTTGMTIAQVIRLNDVMLLEERLKLAIRTTRAFTFFFLTMSLIFVVTSPPNQWLEPALWVIAIAGIMLHGLMAFGRPEKWQAIGTIFFFSTITFTALVALLGTFQ